GVEYAQRLRLLDPESWYREAPNPLHRLLDLTAKSSIAPDVVLLDAQAGISPISAPLLFYVSDLAVICFLSHPQAPRGTELLVKALLASRTRRSSGDRPISPEPRFLVSPVPPGPSAERVRSRALSWIDGWLGRVYDRRDSGVDQLQGDELTHFISYSPELAYRDQIASGASLGEDYAAIVDWVEQVLPQAEGTTVVRPATKRQVLDELDFSTGMAEYQESFFEDF